MARVHSESAPYLGFIGLGEAALRFAQDLSAAGLPTIAAYTGSGAKAQPGDAIIETKGAPRG